jgi:uncharacterized protein
MTAPQPVTTISLPDQYRQAAITTLTSQLERYQSSPVELRAQLQPYLAALSGLQQKLFQPLLQIAVFGLVSRGKSAVLNALVGESLFPTGPLNGVTQWPRAVRWAVAANNGPQDAIQLELVDTPGLDEISGEARTAMAQEIARCSDLILFVTAGPPTPTEEKALAELIQFSKPLIWVVNKADLYPELTAADLHQGLTEPPLQRVLSPQDIILVSAAPVPVQVRHEWPDGRTNLDWEISTPQVEPLRQALLHLLQQEGLYLLSLNVLLQSQTFEAQMVPIITAYYAEPIQAAQWQIWGVKALLVSLCPSVGVDLFISLGADIMQVRQLSRICGFPITSHNIRLLWKSLLTSLLWLAAAELPSGLQGWLFDGSTSTGLQLCTVMGAQVIAAIYGAARVGKAAQTYLQDGITWNSQGPSQLIQNIQAALDPPDDHLHNLEG